MTPDRYQKIVTIFRTACTYVGSERDAYLSQACGDDSAMRAEVESLLAFDAQAGDFMESESGNLLPQADIVGITGTTFMIIHSGRLSE